MGWKSAPTSKRHLINRLTFDKNQWKQQRSQYNFQCQGARWHCWKNYIYRLAAWSHDIAQGRRKRKTRGISLWWSKSIITGSLRHFHIIFIPHSKYRSNKWERWKIPVIWDRKKKRYVILKKSNTYLNAPLSTASHSLYFQIKFADVLWLTSKNNFFILNVLFPT